MGRTRGRASTATARLGSKSTSPPKAILSNPEFAYTSGVPSSSLQALLARAGTALERGRGPEAAQMLGPALRSGGLTREDELAVRSALAEAWLLQDDLDQAAAALGRTPDTFRDTISAARLST